MMMEIRLRILLLALLVLATPATFAFNAFAQTDSPVCSPNKNNEQICVDPIWSDGGNVRFKVTFPTYSPHIDYTFVVKSESGSVVFDAAQKVGQTTLHTADAAVTIPQEPDSPLKLDSGSYTVNATIFGIQFSPVTPYSFSMSVTVTPEFPVQLVVATAGFVGAAVVASRLVLGKTRTLS